MPLSPRPRAPGQQVQAQGGESVLFSIMVPVVDQYWASTGPVLGQYWGQYWASTGPVLGHHWGRTGPVLYQYWGQYCISTGASTGASTVASTGASTGPVLGSVLDQYWTSSGVNNVPVL